MYPYTPSRPRVFLFFVTDGRLGGGDLLRPDTVHVLLAAERTHVQPRRGVLPALAPEDQRGQAAVLREPSFSREGPYEGERCNAGGPSGENLRVVSVEPLLRLRH